MDDRSAARGWGHGRAVAVAHDRAAAPGITIRGNLPVADYVSYTSLGYARRTDGALQMGTFTVCRTGHKARKGSCSRTVVARGWNARWRPAHDAAARVHLARIDDRRRDHRDPRCIALPSYAAYVTRSRVLDAVTRLADARARMDDYFQDQRTYVDDAGHCGVTAPAAATDYFVVACEATTTAFTYTATGLAAKGMASFVYSIDQAGNKATVSVPPGWSRTADCWTIRQDGFRV